MALDLHTLRNVGEFYSQHYLDEVLEGDLKEIWKGWSKAAKDGGKKAPSEALLSLKRHYFEGLAKLRGVDVEHESAEQLEQRRWLARDFHVRLMECLGYAYEASSVFLGDPSAKEALPLVGRVELHGQPHLWIVQAPFPASEDDNNPFDEAPVLPFERASNSAPEGEEWNFVQDSWRSLLDERVFRQEHPPRWLLFLAAGDVFLIDRHKWAQGQYLHFELGKMLGSEDKQALKVLAGMLHREVLAPDDGQTLLDRLDDNSHKHAFEVSTDLKFGVQRAIELIGNEAVYYRRNVAKEGVFNQEDFAKELTNDCINYLYRLLFLFFVEARSDQLDMLPMKSDIYRMGYSLESLRDLELVELSTQGSRDGYFLHNSLQKLFEIVQGGFGSGQLELLASAEGGASLNARYDFGVPALRSQLFDPEKTPILSSVKLRNFVLREVLELLSLSRPGGSSGKGRGKNKRKQRGRISYATLGINQLGAVYEGLLSYTGFFAKEKIYEVRAPKEIKDENARTFFVPHSQIEKYEDNCKVKDENGVPKTYPKGAYLFRLSGRDRETSASYYTPEVLTRCLTKLTIKERIKAPGEEGALTADEILELTVCEPAMGSGAFLNEAVNQLADAYLERKQAETGKTIPSEDYQAEKQKVKYHFVAHNCFGVDLNPLAAQLGKISLWLNVLQPDVQTPYLDLHLRVGNSLIGARREVYDGADLQRSKDGWKDKVPTRVPWGEKRPKGSVYHFLVFDPGMVPFDQDRVVRSLCPDEVAAIRAWKREMGKPYSKAEVKELVELSDEIDRLWAEHVETQRAVEEQLRQPIEIWGQDKPEGRWKSVQECEEIGRRVWEGRDGQVTAGARLKAVMDYWCGLWFWPLLDADSLPTRGKWRQKQSAMLVQQRTTDTARAKPPTACLHWDLEFAHLFVARSGVDLTIGNPPWIKVEWQESGVLGDLDPYLVIRPNNAKRIAGERKRALKSNAELRIYTNELEKQFGSKVYIGASQNYEALSGIQSNLYKCFIAKSWDICGGAIGFIVQPGLLDDPRGGHFRNELYSRGLRVYRFTNNLGLFPEIGSLRPYCMLTFNSAKTDSISLVSLSNLVHPSTVLESLSHDGIGEVPRIKNQADEWDLRPHESRVVSVDHSTLALFAKLYDPPGTPVHQARLPVVHSREVLDVLRRFAEAPRKLGDLKDEYFCTVCFDETNRQSDGTIKADVCFPEKVEDWVVSGPHFYVGTPFNKTPNEGCRSKGDYTPLDLTQIPDDYLPRTKYVRACSPAEYRKRTPHWNGRPVTEFYRLIHRRRIGPGSERTLATAIIPPGCANINTTVATAFSQEDLLLHVAGITAGIPLDFFLKTTGKPDLYGDDLANLATLTSNSRIQSLIVNRTLILNCLTRQYADLWSRNAAGCPNDSFCHDDPRLPSWDHLTTTWTRDSGLRTPYARRQALVELDALAALSLGLTLDELLLIYRVQFPVLQQYERETFYDQRGKIVFTTNRGLSGVGLTRKEWEQVQNAKSGDTLPEWAKDAQGPFVAPFDRCDREADMAQAYAHFAQLTEEKPKAPPETVAPQSEPPLTWDPELEPTREDAA